MKQLFNYFFKGLLIIVPLTVTIYILILVIGWLDNLIPIGVPGMGLLLILVVTTGLGYFANLFFIGSFFRLFETFVEKIPLVNIIYSSLRDLTSAFVGEKRRFDQAVLVSLSLDSTILKPGFVTSDDLEKIGLPGFVTVYMPHSYNFSGNIIIVNSKHVIPIEASGADVMRYIVSGGVSGAISVDKSHKSDDPS